MQERIYKRAPHFVKVIMLNLKAWINRKKRNSRLNKEYANKYISLWTKDLDKVKTFQKNELRNLLLECFKYVPHYSRILKQIGFSERDIDTDPEKVLSSMPLLLKTARKENFDSLSNSNPDRKAISVGYTSGTSGTPMRFLADRETVAKSFALWARFHKSIGLEGKFKSVRFSGRLIVDPKRQKPPFWIRNYFDDQWFMSSYHLSVSNIPFYIDKLNSIQPELIDGYPSAIYLISKFSNSNDKPITFTPKAISVTAETLYDHHRSEIEQAFGCKVFNQYSSSEGGPPITECKNGKMHINIDSGYFEFLDDEDKPAKPGELGRIIVTGFRNMMNPLIRYDIGDIALLSKDSKTCSCGCEMPYVETIIGREDDLLWTEEKGYVGRMDTAYKGLKGIVKSKIIQNSPLEFVVLNIVDSDYSTSIQDKFETNLKDRLGQNIEIRFKIVEDIELGPNGKFEAVKRNFELNI